MSQIINLADYIGKFNPILKSFIENTCDIDLSVASKKDIYSLAKLISIFSIWKIHDV